MPSIEMYSSPLCGYCHAAKRLLKKKGAAFTDHNVLMNPELKRKMMARAGGAHTVPQIFIGTTHVGGCDELFALEREGRLDKLLED